MQVELELKTKIIRCTVTPVAGGVKLVDAKKHKVRAVLDLTTATITKSGLNLIITGAKDWTAQVTDKVIFIKSDSKVSADVYTQFLMAQKFSVVIVPLLLEARDEASILCDDSYTILYSNTAYNNLVGSKASKKVNKIFTQIPGINSITIDEITTVCNVNYKSITKDIILIEVVPSTARLRSDGTSLVVSELRHLQIENSALREQLTEFGAATPRTINKYSLGNIIGKGKFGTVFLGTNSAGNKVAIKRLPNKSLDLQSEVETLSQLEHPNIIRYYECLIGTNETLIVTEYCNRGNLQELRQTKKLTHMHIVAIMYQLLTAIQYLHDHQIIHRDIKSTNILINSKGYVKVADFGIAVNVNDSRGMISMAGTPCYLAPETISGLDSTPSSIDSGDSKKTIPYKADIWSCGIVLLELLDNKVPWQDLNFIEILCALSRGDRPVIDSSNYPPLVNEILEMMLVQDPTKRSSAKEILESKCFDDPSLADPTSILRLWYA